MNPIVIFSVCLVLTTLTACSGRAATNEPIGKYQVSKSDYDDGSYKPVNRNEGRYIHMVKPYVHTPDNRELGQYRHIPIPYNGGYGPYSGLLNPYRHDQDGNYDKYTTTSTTTRRPTTTTTTTVRPRLFNYYEEGGWRILRQEEEKKKHKYDFLYHTENGIYGEEKAHLRKDAGTAASGYYEYTGDDGELYRVNYKSDERGFIPEGDHIPTAPPIPDAIKRALEYTAKKKEIHGAVQTGQYEHKADPVRSGRPVRLQNTPTIDRPLSDVQPVPYQSAPIAPVASLGPQPRFLQYDAGNKYDPLPTGLGSVSSQTEKPLVYESQSIAPYETDQKVAQEQDKPDQQQQQQPLLQEQQQPQLEQQQPQLAQQEELPQSDQPQQDDLSGSEVQEQEPQASEQHNVFLPPYQVPEKLSDHDNFEFATA